MIEKRISIIIPFYNAEKYIVQCLNSVMIQDYSNYEVILINDGSSDRSETIVLDKAAMIKCNYKYLYEENAGVSAARNYGLNESTGEYIIFLDADDYLADNNCLKCVNEVISQSDVDIVFFQLASTLDNLENPRLNHLNVKDISCQEAAEEIYRIRNKYDFNFTGIGAKVYRKETILKNHILFNNNLKVGEDTIFNLDVLRCSKNAKLVRYTFYCYRNNVNSTTNQYITNYIENDETFLREYLNISKFFFDLPEAYKNKIILSGLVSCCKFDYCNRNNNKNIWVIASNMKLVKDRLIYNKIYSSRRDYPAFHDFQSFVIFILFFFNRYTLFFLYLLMLEIKENVKKGLDNF